jgi:hypothetical protein
MESVSPTSALRFVDPSQPFLSPDEGPGPVHARRHARAGFEGTALLPQSFGLLIRTKAPSLGAPGWRSLVLEGLLEIPSPGLSRSP